MPFGMGKVNIANMNLLVIKLYQDVGIQKVFRN